MSTSPRRLNTMSRRGLIVGGTAVAAAVTFRSRPATLQPRPLPKDRAFPSPSVLTSPPQLYQQLVVERTIPTLLDASLLASYRSRHINGAQHVWWQDSMELNEAFYGTVLKRDDDQTQGRRQALMERWNITTDRPVVVYDDTDTDSASRVAWFLRFMGVAATVLDGGMSAWLAIEGPTTSNAFGPNPGGIQPVAPQPDYYLVVDQVANRLSLPDTRVIDLREVDERRSGSFQGFTIPNAADMPRSLFGSPAGWIRDPQSLAALLAQAAIDPQSHLILMAPTGMDARLPAIALAAMGATRVSICDGGWQEWVTKPGVPLESLANKSTGITNLSAQYTSGTLG